MLSMRGFKYSDGMTSGLVVHSYEENMGHFEAAEQVKTHFHFQFPSSLDDYFLSRK
jgi:hypothetical protein